MTGHHLPRRRAEKRVSAAPALHADLLSWGPSANRWRPVKDVSKRRNSLQLQALGNSTSSDVLNPANRLFGSCHPFTFNSFFFTMLRVAAEMPGSVTAILRIAFLTNKISIIFAPCVSGRLGSVVSVSPVNHHLSVPCRSLHARPMLAVLPATDQYLALYFCSGLSMEFCRR